MSATLETKASRRRKSRRQRGLAARTYELPKVPSQSRNRRARPSAAQVHRGLTARELDWDSLVLQHLANRNDGITTLSNVGSSALDIEQFLDRKTVLIGAELWNTRNTPDFLPQEALIDDEHRAYAERSVASVANWIISGGDNFREEYEYLQNAFVDAESSVRNLTIANYHLSDGHHHNRQLKIHRLGQLETLVIGIQSHAVWGGEDSARRYAGEVQNILSVQPRLKRLTLVQVALTATSDDGAYPQAHAASWFKTLACRIGVEHSKLDTPSVDILVLAEEQREEVPVRVVATHPFQIWPLPLKGASRSALHSPLDSVLEM